VNTRFFLKQCFGFGTRPNEIYVSDQPDNGFEDYYTAENWAWDNLRGYGEDNNWFVVEERV
jgi:hypothetical protein